MRPQAVAALVGALFLAATCAPAGTPAPLRARFACDASEAAPGRPFECDVFLENPQDGAPVVVPRTLVPFELGFRPPMVIELEATRSGRMTRLEIAPPAQRGRYDFGTLGRDELMILSPGTLYGWRYDLNGDDWLLPSEPGEYEIRARIRVQLLKPRKDGSLEPAVSQVLGRHASRAESLVMNGQWVSNPVKVSVRPGK